MSRFFRRSEDSSSDSSSESEPGSESDGAIDDRDETQSISPTASGLDDAAPTNNAIERPSSGNFHQNFLLHALLEERCTNDVLATYFSVPYRQRPRRDAPEVKAQVDARYQRICAHLAQYNLISTGPEAEQHAASRQRYRHGLDLLSQQISAGAVPPAFRRLLTETETEVGSSSESPNARRGILPEDSPMYPLAVRPMPFTMSNLFPHADTMERQFPVDRSMQLLQPSSDALGVHHHNVGGVFRPQFAQQFQELGTLGHGGYGIVYQVKHRIDQQTYAVKKIPLSATRLQRIEHTGGLNELLLEVQTLAHLDHPNIVRYHTAWIEWVDAMSLESVTPPKSYANTSDDTISGATKDSHQSFHRVVTENDSDATDISFEGSGPWEDQAESNNSIDLNRASTDSNIFQLHKVRTKSSTASGSEDTVETIGRDFDASASIKSGVHGAHFREPTWALHMQMGFHPMTLAEFLWPPSETESVTKPLAHCFHVEPAISILHAILDGIEYLHSKGIVHRDIKPSNIFMGPKDDSWSARSCVDLALCHDCRAQDKATHMKVEVRIGDFGLVTIADTTHTAPKSEAMGTELYRPATSETSSPSLDIFALGIVAFELVWKFNTAWERIDTIRNLKRNEFPHNFSERTSREQGAKLKECIKAMLSHQGSGMSIPDLRHMLCAIQST